MSLVFKKKLLVLFNYTHIYIYILLFGRVDESVRIAWDKEEKAAC